MSTTSDPVRSLEEAIEELEQRREWLTTSLREVNDTLNRHRAAMRLLRSTKRIRNSPSDHNERERNSQQARDRIIEELTRAKKPLMARELSKRLPEYTLSTVAGNLSTLRREKLVDWQPQEGHQSGLWMLKA